MDRAFTRLFALVSVVAAAAVMIAPGALRGDSTLLTLAGAALALLAVAGVLVLARVVTAAERRSGRR